MKIYFNLQPDLDAKDFLALGVKVGDKLKIDNLNFVIMRPLKLKKAMRLKKMISSYKI